MAVTGMTATATSRVVGRSAAGSGPDAPALADRLFEVLPRTVRRMRQETRARFDGDLTVPQVRAVMFLRRRPGSGLTGLADHLGISRPAASVLVDALVAGGLVDRSRDPEERRRVRLALTPAGTTTAGEARSAARGWLASALADLPESDRAALGTAIGLLDRITEARP
jgi:DNA-binding MarR family transcriptional regulator